MRREETVGSGTSPDPTLVPRTRAQSRVRLTVREIENDRVR
jgi:hypothetical protein